MALVRSLLFAAIFYPATVLWVLVGVVATLLGRRPTLAVILGWVRFHHGLTVKLLGIRSTVLGAIPAGPHLIAVKHQSMYETLEMVRLTNLPVVVENSCKACVLAQVWAVRGDAPLEGPIAFVNVSDGVGVGIAIDGKLLRGANNIAGEFGHVPLDIHGPGGLRSALAARNHRRSSRLLPLLCL